MKLQDIKTGEFKRERVEVGSVYIRTRALNIGRRVYE
mgnify:CR=1 FL=1